MVTAAATASLSGPFALQGRQAARGLEVWASSDQIELEIVDDAGSPGTAIDAYEQWLIAGVDLLLGPYGSGLVRRVAPLASAAGALLWNHGGSADDLAGRLVVPLAAPASTYFRGSVALAQRMGLRRIVLVRGRGPFASAVASGARRHAAELGLAVRQTDLAAWSTAGSLSEDAVLIVGTFAEDLSLVEQIRTSEEPGLLGCVAAGLFEFGNRLGSSADGIVGPVQWISETTEPEIGPSGADFSLQYETAHGEPPSYVAAQAAAAGFLAAAAHRRGYGHDDVARWRTTTPLGSFALDGQWRQVGHSAITIEWRDGRQVRSP